MANVADIIIFGGQSNMEGQTEVLSECEIVEGAFEYKLIGDSLVPLKNPVGEDIRYDGLAGETFMQNTDAGKWLDDHVLGSACYGHTNMVPSFCRAYIKERQTAVIAVHAAKGSTVIKDWLPDSNGYRALVAKAAAAIKRAEKEYKIGHIYFVWLHGESDAIFANSKENYKDSLRVLMGGLAAELGVEKFGIIRVGAFANDERDFEIIGAQDEICEEDERFLMLCREALAFNKMPEMMNPYVDGHYSARGLEELGRIAGGALGEFSKGNRLS